jgi:hypothetical protein|tara:strand:+ start:506 stop:679 length:174 start_codon:yes stop_codon:yes gene_type:complete
MSEDNSKEEETQPEKKIDPASLSAYMAEIGRRGGKANKGKKATVDKCRNAAKARWKK